MRDVLHGFLLTTAAAADQRIYKQENKYATWLQLWNKFLNIGNLPKLILFLIYILIYNLVEFSNKILVDVCFLMLCMFVCGLQRRYDGDPAEHKMASGFDAILLQRPFPNISYWKP